MLLKRGQSRNFCTRTPDIVAEGKLSADGNQDSPADFVDLKAGPATVLGRINLLKLCFFSMENSESRA